MRYLICLTLGGLVLGLAALGCEERRGGYGYQEYDTYGYVEPDHGYYDYYDYGPYYDGRFRERHEHDERFEHHEGHEHHEAHEHHEGSGHHH